MLLFFYFYRIVESVFFSLAELLIMICQNDYAVNIPINVFCWLNKAQEIRDNPQCWPNEFVNYPNWPQQLLWKCSNSPNNEIMISDAFWSSIFCRKRMVSDMHNYSLSFCLKKNADQNTGRYCYFLCYSEMCLSIIFKYLRNLSLIEKVFVQIQ